MAKKSGRKRAPSAASAASAAASAPSASAAASAPSAAAFGPGFSPETGRGVIAAASAAHAAYSISVAALVLAANLRVDKTDGVKAAAGAAFTTEALSGMLRASLVWLAPAIERLTGADTRPGPRGHLVFFGAVAALLAGARILPAVFAGAAPSMVRLNSLSAGGLAVMAASELAGALGKTLGLLLFCLVADEAARRGGRGGLAIAGALAFAFVALEVGGLALAMWFERDLLEHEPGEAVRPLDRPELVKRVKAIAADMGMPEAAENVMVDDADDSLNAFAMRRVVVLSRRTAALADVEHAAAVAAHELAHVKLRHVRKSTAMYSFVSAGRFALLFVALALPGLLLPPTTLPWIQTAIPLATASRSAGVLYVVARPLVDELGRAAALSLSRGAELAADRLGAEAVGQVKYVEMLRKLEEDAPGMGEPFERLLAHRMTHPPIDRRVAEVTGA
jgi:Zn-dependent protease with chaperone function